MLWFKFLHLQLKSNEALQFTMIEQQIYSKITISYL